MTLPTPCPDSRRNTSVKSPSPRIARRPRICTDLFPGRKTVPKTLIFAKDDSHADDIVQIVREVFGKGNQFATKITYGTRDGKPEDLLQAFRNSMYPRIVVTVDMIATGTDVKPLEFTSPADQT
jgi:type I restriction enzyme R subunit